MSYPLTRTYDTDKSRTDVRTTLANVAKALADAKGLGEVPTKTVFEEPDLLDEDDNRFKVNVRPTVTDAGFEPEELIPSEVVYHGVYIRLHGMASAHGDERAYAHVTVREAGPADEGKRPDGYYRATPWDVELARWRKISGQADDEPAGDDDEPEDGEVATDGGVVTADGGEVADEDEGDRVLGEFEVTEDLAREDDAFTVYDLPADMADEHLTTTFTPVRYAKVCRDVAYFARGVGSAPQKGMGQTYGSPGSGMRRSKEGALYGLAHREALLSRAVDLGLITIANGDGFDADESEWRFDLAPRGAWFLQHFYGEHVPVRHVRKVQLSRFNAATNVDKVVITPSDDVSISSVESWNKQVDLHDTHGRSVGTGYYHIGRDVVDAPAEDPAGEPLTTVIRETSVPTQFDVSGLDGDVRVACDVEAVADEGTLVDPTSLTVARDDETGDLLVRKALSRADVEVGENSGGNNPRLGVLGDYDPFVTSGAKDALKAAVDADYNADYKTWYVGAEDGLAAIEAMLRDSEIDEVTLPARVFAEFTEYL